MIEKVYVIKPTGLIKEKLEPMIQHWQDRRRSKLYLAITHLIRHVYKRGIDKWKIDTEKHFIACQEWHDVIGKDSWKEIKPVLMEAGILYSDEIKVFRKKSKLLDRNYDHAWIEKSKCYGYRFQDKLHLSQEWEIGNVPTNHLCKSYKDQLRSKRGKPRNTAFQYSEQMGRFKIDTKAAIQMVDTMAPDRKWSLTQQLVIKHQIQTFNTSAADFVIISGTGREYNKFNCLSVPIRKFITIDGKTACELDMKSAAPAAMIPFIQDQKERESWKKLIEEGRFYEQIASFINNRPNVATRLKVGEVKESFSRFIGGGKIKTKFIRQWIEVNYPVLFAQYNAMPKGEFSRKTQALESKVIMTPECQKLGGSIHDCLLITDEPEIEREARELISRLCGEHFQCRVILERK